MYQALYRKYRPRTFSDVTGQEHITETLKRQIMTGRLSHAYLFVGTRGTGKTTCAKILSKAVNCLDPQDGDPCNKCASCLGIESGSILDVLEIDAASNNSVDNVRALREEAVYSPASVSKRVYIIDEVHMLSTAAFNALLKILEEPPEHLLFILATTERHKVPATILSRCQRFSFKRLSPATISARLSLVSSKEGLELTDEAADKIASLADGAMRDGLSLLDQCASDVSIDLKKVLETIGLANNSQLLEMTRAITIRDVTAALGILDSLYNDGSDMASLLNELAGISRDLLVFRLAADSPLLSGNFSKDELLGLSEGLAPERLFEMLNVIREAGSELSRSGNARLTSEMCIIRLCDERLNDDGAAIVARLKRLESGTFTVAAPDIAMPVGAAVPVVASVSKPDASPIISVAKPVAPGPKPVIEAFEPADTDGWSAILKELEDDVSVHSLLSDSSEIFASLEGNILTISTGNPFTIVQLESAMFSDAIKTAAEKALGREIILKTATSDGKASDSANDKLDKLMDSFNFNVE